MSTITRLEQINARLEFARGDAAREILGVYGAPNRGSKFANQVAARLRTYRTKPLTNAVLHGGNKGLRIITKDEEHYLYPRMTPKVKSTVLPNLEKQHARFPFDIHRNALGETVVRESARTNNVWYIT